MEALFIGLNFRKCKWLLCGLYHPPSQKDQYFFDIIVTRNGNTGRTGRSTQLC